jgi:2-dehydropantoate 2-reductase
MYDPGHAIRTDRSQVGFKIGEHDGKVTERAERLAKIMCDVAPTKVTTNLWGERWSKLSVNCMANGLAGLSGLGSAEVRTRDGVRRVAIHLAAETIKVGRARGHEVEPIWGITAQRFVDASEGRAMADVERDMAERAKELAGGRPSLLQDVMRGRRTEVQYLNGYVSEQGRQAGVPTPFNDKVVELITRVPPGTLKPDPRNLDPLVAMLPK